MTNTEEREMNGKKVKVIRAEMTLEQARKAYPYRPFSKYAESRFGGNSLCDDICLLLNERADWCKMCQAPTKKEYLEGEVCPDCDGRSEMNGVDPHGKIY